MIQRLHSYNLLTDKVTEKVYIYILTLYAFLKMSYLKIKQKDIHKNFSYISTLYESSNFIQGFSYWRNWGRFPPISQKFAHSRPPPRKISP